ncbi:hypothetical protein OIM90_24185 [Streptomyces sp. AD16]|nr:hypothetical protein NQP46_08150 [Streptomyces albus]WDV33272.1 hypothetical protein OIM90_24185 [Streptomyces sp. AD16]
MFAEDEVIPVELVCALWRESAGYEPVRSRALCRRLRDVALVGLTDSGAWSCTTSSATTCGRNWGPGG